MTALISEELLCQFSWDHKYRDNHDCCLLGGHSGPHKCVCGCVLATKESAVAPNVSKAVSQ